MKLGRKFIFIAALGVAPCLFSLLLTGCGTPAAPAPPTLDLPEPVENLAATRSGDTLTLTWTQPKRNTDKMLLKGDVDVLLCHRVGEGECEPLNEVYVAPGKDEHIEVAMPRALAVGEPRGVAFAVQSMNHLKRSAGLSNEAWVIAGAAPAAVEGLTAEEKREGVVLRWNPQPGANVAVRLIRRRLSAPVRPRTQTKKELLAPPDEPEVMSFWVEDGNGGKALDRTAHTGESYEYTAERVIRVKVKTESLELKSDLSAAAALDVLDIYPPPRPEGLAAVANGEEGHRAIDLSWQPSIATGLSSPAVGYIVFRRESSEGQADNPAEWERISGVGLVTGLAFHDANVSAGHSYIYAVTAVGTNTLESRKSEPASESVE